MTATGGRAAVAAAGTRAAADHGAPWLLVAMLLTAAVLRLMHLDTELWFDEIATLTDYVTLPLAKIPFTYDSQNQHPLYSLLARVAYVATDGAAWSIRLPAVLFGVASLWATYWLARQIASRAEALLAVLVLSFSYHHVWFSQNARGYTAMLFFTVIATGLFVRLAEGTPSRPARLAWIYGAVMALATYTHLTAALVAVGHALALILSVAWRRNGRVIDALRWPVVALVASALLTVALYAPVLPDLVRVLLEPTMGGVAVEWTSGRWMLLETVRVLGAGVPGGVPVVLAAGAILVIGMVSYWRQSRLLVLACVCPIAVTAATMLALQHNLWPRFFFFAASFIVLFALRGGFVIVRALLPRVGDRVAVVGAVLVAAVSALTVPRAWQPKQQLYAAADFVESQRAPGDAVAALDMAANAYRGHRTPPGWLLTDSLEDLQALERTSTRTWVVYIFPTRLRAAFPELAAHVTQSTLYREVRVFPATVGGGEVRVLLHDSGPAHD
ncbi:MAG TPA: glycosyltransferase family 39 protein [Gemmatimonadaceae bacterium]